MRRYLDTCLRNVIWIGLSVILVPIAVALVSRQLTKSFDATSEIWVDAPVAAPSSDPTATKTAADAYTSIFQELLVTRSFRAEIADGVSKKLGRPLPTDAAYEAFLTRIQSGTKISSAGPNLVQVDYKDPDANVAVATAAVAVDTFQTEVLRLKQDAASQRVTLYQQQIDQVRHSLTASDIQSILGGSASATPTSVSDVDLASQLDLLKSLEDRRNTALGDSIDQTVAVPATLHVIDVPHVDSSAKTNWAMVALAGVAGLVLTLAVDLAVIAILTVTDRTVHGVSDVTPLTGVPVHGLPRVGVARLEDVRRVRSV